MKKNIIRVVLAIQVQFLFGEQGNKQIIFREQRNKRKIILRNKAIYFRGTEADFSGEQVPPPPLGGPPYCTPDQVTIMIICLLYAFF